MSGSARRLGQLDALRGLAALLVVGFHYTTRYQDLYGHTSAPLLSLPWGHYGVNLFFMISGFVIFMTLERTRRPMDFVVSRFSRLYPAYWGALLLTFALTHLLGLPGKEVGWPTLLANVTMLQELAGVAHVDGVYWTLTVELLFYAWALLSWLHGGGQRLCQLLWAFLAIRAVYVLAASWGGVDLPWVLQRWMLLPYIAWFALGVAVYRLTQRAWVLSPGDVDQPSRETRDSPPTRNSDEARHGGETRKGGVSPVHRGSVISRAVSMVLGGRRPFGMPGDWQMAVAAVLVIGLGQGAWVGLLAVGCLILLYGAALGRWTWLEHRLWLWLGSISYTLYLLHENIGWALLRRLEAMGIPATLAIVLVLAVSLGLAHALTHAVEQPVMRWIRRRYQQRQLREAAA